MQKLKLSLFFLFLSLASHAQVTFVNSDKHDFGDIEQGGSLVADFQLLNADRFDFFFLRADLPEDCVIKYSVKEVRPDSTAIVRIKFNPTKKGPFNRDIKVYISSENEPLTFTISGNVKYIDPSADYRCPDFNMPVSEKQVQQEFVIQVIDAQSYKPIKSATLKFQPNPRFFPLGPTDAEGMVNVKLPIGLYDIEASARGYTPDVRNFYIGRQTGSVMLLLEPEQPPVQVVENPPVVIADEPREYIPQDSVPAAPVVVAPVVVAPAEPEYVEKPGELAFSEYAPNNVVFLIDVSSSMGQPDKLPLLKESMKVLLGNLRSIDRVSIVTYASETDVVMPSTTADKKDQIAEKIDNLRAYGRTEGGKGIREAYRVAEENYIPGGNNQIFVATDGDFELDRSDRALFRFIEGNSQEIKLSVVGCGQKQRAIEKMEKIAESGQGSYIHIGSEEQARSNLVDEIKLRSRRRR